MQNVRYVLLAVLLAAAVLHAQAPDTTSVDSLQIQILRLQKRVQQIENKQAENDLAALRRQAANVANAKEERQQPHIFKSGQRSLQAINPEISVTGDAFLQAVGNSDGFNETARSGAYFRVLGLHFQSALDPFSFTKIAVEIHPEGIELGEAYATWSNVFKNVSLTAGKFRQQFGVVNRWHAHSLDQFDFPLAMTTILGEEGLNQTGVSLEWLMPSLLAKANTLTIQITNSQNEQLFSGSSFSFPAVLGHLKNYYDLNQNTYLEIGLSGMAGYNDSLVYKAKRQTRLAGADITLFWEPLNQAHYHSFLWRSEFYYASKELVSGQHLKAWGFYSTVDYKMNERWNAGIRYDYTQPFELENSGQSIWQLVPYVTWWQSHWVRFRLQYNYKDGNVLSTADKILRLQLTFAAGPHKHERY